MTKNMTDLLRYAIGSWPRTLRLLALTVPPPLLHAGVLWLTQPGL